MTPRLGLTRRERVAVWVSLIVLTLLTADVAVDGPVSHVDRQIRDAIQPRDDGVPWWLAAISELGDLRIAVPVVVAGALVAAQYSWRVWPAVFAIGTLAAVELAVLALKAAVGRAGPGIWADREDYPGYFPSGHAATAMSVVAIGVFMAYRLGLIRLRIAAGEEIAVLAGLAVGLVAGAGAVVSDSHWASDVVGGVALAAVILVPALALCRGYLDGAGADGTSRRSSAGTRRLGGSSSP